MIDIETRPALDRYKCEWSPGEESILRDAYRRADGDHRRAIDLCRRHLPGRKEGSIKKHAVALRLTQSCKTREETVSPIEVRRLERVAPVRTGRPVCTHCGNKVLFKNEDGDWDCLPCGTIMSATLGDGRRG